MWLANIIGESPPSWLKSLFTVSHTPSYASSILQTTPQTFPDHKLTYIYAPHLLGRFMCMCKDILTVSGENYRYNIHTPPAYKKFMNGFACRGFDPYSAISLTYLPIVPHICVGKLIVVVSDNGLPPRRRQAIIKASAGILLIGPLGKFERNSKKMHFYMSSAKMAAISSRGRWVNSGHCQKTLVLRSAKFILL